MGELSEMIPGIIIALAAIVAVIAFGVCLLGALFLFIARADDKLLPNPRDVGLGRLMFYGGIGTMIGMAGLIAKVLP